MTYVECDRQNLHNEVLKDQLANVFPAISKEQNSELICKFQATCDTPGLPALIIETGDNKAKAKNLLPENFSLTSSKPGQVKVELGKLFELLPEESLSPAYKDLLAKMKSINIDGKAVKVEGQATAALPFEIVKGQSATLQLRYPSCEIVPDEKDPNTVHLKNIKGVSVMGVPLPDTSISLEKDREGNAQLKFSVGKVLTQSVPIDKETTGAIERGFGQIRNWTAAPGKAKFSDLIAGTLGADLKQFAGGAFDGITGIKSKNGTLEISREKAGQYDLAGMKLDLAASVKARVEQVGKDTVISKIEGVSVKLPLPAEIAAAAGIKDTIAIKEVRLGEPDKDGNRLISVKTDSAIDSYKLRLDKNMQPCRDGNGNICFEFDIKKGSETASLSLTMKPEDLNGKGKIPDFKVQVKEGGGAAANIVESIIGKPLDGTLKEMIGGVKSISKRGDTVMISRDKSSTHDMNGGKLEAGKTIMFKIQDDGLGGFKLDKIAGLTYKVNTQLPAVAKSLGLNLPDNVPVAISSIDVSKPIENGKRYVGIETDSPVKRISTIVGPDGKPALDSNEKFHTWVKLENPLDAARPFNFSLRFDKSNQLDMTKLELLQMLAHLAPSVASTAARTGLKVVNEATDTLLDLSSPLGPVKLFKKLVK